MRVRQLSPRYLGPFQILKQIGTSAYQIALPLNLSNLHNVFHVLEPESIQLIKDLTLNLLIVKIMDKGTKQLRHNFVPLVKVAWGSRKSEEFTWELEQYMRKDYPELFRGNKF